MKLLTMRKLALSALFFTTMISTEMAYCDTTILVDDRVLPNGNIERIVYRGNSATSIASTAILNSQHRLIGPVKEYDYDGSLERVANYRADGSLLEVITYDKKGNIQVISKYEADGKTYKEQIGLSANGKYVKQYKDGKAYVDMQFDKDGNLIESGDYVEGFKFHSMQWLNGKPHGIETFYKLTKKGELKVDHRVKWQNGQQVKK